MFQPSNQGGAGILQPSTVSYHSVLRNRPTTDIWWHLEIPMMQSPIGAAGCKRFFVDQCRLKRQTKRQEISLVTKETKPPYELYASPVYTCVGNWQVFMVMKWHCHASISRILYLDTDILVTGSLWHLLQLPAVHFAASGLGASSVLTVPQLSSSWDSQLGMRKPKKILPGFVSSSIFDWPGFLRSLI